MDNIKRVITNFGEIVLSNVARKEGDESPVWIRHAFLRENGSTKALLNMSPKEVRRLIVSYQELLQDVEDEIAAHQEMVAKQEGENNMTETTIKVPTSRNRDLVIEKEKEREGHMTRYRFKLEAGGVDDSPSEGLFYVKIQDLMGLSKDLKRETDKIAAHQQVENNE